jgi:FAD:protein FMN transferase
MALATSGGYGLLFDAAGRFNHILDPRTGACAPSRLMVSVIAQSATTADALSTAFSLIPLERAFTIAEKMKAAVRFSTARGVRASSSWPV